MQKKLISILLASLCLAGAATQVHAQAQTRVVAQVARPDTHAARAMLLAAATAGSRIVAVGANGYVLLSDDGGASYRQARQVPVDFTLTGVWFADASNGWAVGHAGSIIHSADGGETWQLQRSETEPDQPLFSVYFSDAQHGWAGGLWSLLLHTSDGGQHWNQIKLPVAAGQKRADLNLLKIFSGPHDAVYIAAEQGTLFRSLDNGEHWDVLKTGSNASLWSGVVSSAGTIVVGGLGGKLLRSSDGGSNWQTVEAGTTGSITSLQARDGVLWASSLEGSVLQSKDDGVSWKTVSAARLPLTTLLLNPAGKPLLYSKEGPISAAK